MVHFSKNLRSFYYLALLVLIVGCKNDQTSKASLVELKNPTVLPLELTIESRTLATVLNTELFNIYELNQKEIVQSKYNLKAEDLWYQGEFLSLLKKSRTAEPQTFGANELISLRISFQCDDCKSAYFYKGAGNDKNIATKVKKMLKEPAAIDHEIIGDYGTFEYNSEKTTLNLMVSLDFTWH